MMTYWLVTVDEFSVKIELVKMLRTWDWSCEHSGELHCYRITSGVHNMPKTGHDRAQVEIMYHARNLAGNGLILWKMRGQAPKVLSKKQSEIQSKTKRMF